MRSTASQVAVALKFLTEKKTEIFSLSFLSLVQTVSFIAIYTIIYTLLFKEIHLDSYSIVAIPGDMFNENLELLLLFFCMLLLFLSSQIRYVIAKKVGMINYSVVFSVRERLITKRFITEKDKQMIIYEARRLGRVTSQFGLLIVMLIQFCAFFLFFLQIYHELTLIFVIAGLIFTWLLFNHFFSVSTAITMLRSDFLILVENSRSLNDASIIASIETVLRNLAGKQYLFFLGKNFFEVFFRFAPIFISIYALYEFKESILYILGLLVILINRFGSLIGLTIGIAEQLSVFTLFENMED